jgi:hypothetical protein
LFVACEFAGLGLREISTLVLDWDRGGGAVRWDGEVKELLRL